ncbi:MAG TPA: hypothetical protein VGE52_04020 [Pirellulales bacterium]
MHSDVPKWTIHSLPPPGFSTPDEAFRFADAENARFQSEVPFDRFCGRRIERVEFSNTQLLLHLADERRLSFHALRQTNFGRMVLSSQALREAAGRPPAAPQVLLTFGRVESLWDRNAIAQWMSGKTFEEAYYSPPHIYLYFAQRSRVSLTYVERLPKNLPLLYWNFDE